MLAATFEPVTGTAVPAERLAAFFVGTSTVLTVVGTALALAICLRAQLALGERRPQRAAAPRAGRLGEAGPPGARRRVPTP